MEITKQQFGHYQDQAVYKYTLENQHHTRLSVLNYAGILQEFSIIDGGQRINLVVSSDQIEGFTANNYNFNRVIGRHAGRITAGKWMQAGAKITVPTNENGHSLHGGANGLGEQFFDVKLNAENDEIILTCKLTPEIDGYPGTLVTTVHYQLTDDDQVKITFEGLQGVSEGVFNPTVHTYFNLSDPNQADITGMTLQVNATKRLELTTTKVPTGVMVPVKGTLFDFTTPTNLGERLRQFAVLTTEKGLDDAFVADRVATEPVAILTDINSQREVKIFSDRQGVVVYTANDLPTSVTHLNRGLGHPYEGIAIEAQGLPDAVNHSNFMATKIAPLETKTYAIMYQYTHL